MNEVKKGLVLKYLHLNILRVKLGDPFFGDWYSYTSNETEYSINTDNNNILKRLK